MPTYMIHLYVAKKVNPNAKIDFYIGNLAPDAVSDREKKVIGHLRNAPNMEAALKEFALKIDATNEYLKGILLHLFVDWKWNGSILADFAKQEGEGWYQKYYNEGELIEAYGFHNTDWAYDLWKQMDLCDYFNYVETDFIIKEEVKALINRSRKWKTANKTDPSAVFTPEIIKKFAEDTAADFTKWLSDLMD